MLDIVRKDNDIDVIKLPSTSEEVFETFFELTTLNISEDSADNTVIDAICYT